MTSTLTPAPEAPALAATETAAAVPETTEVALIDAVDLAGQKYLAAVTSGDLDTVRKTRPLNAKARDADGNTDIMLAIIYGQADCFAFLLANKARLGDVNHANESGFELLVTAPKAILEAYTSSMANPTHATYFYVADQVTFGNSATLQKQTQPRLHASIKAAGIRGREDLLRKKPDRDADPAHVWKKLPPRAERPVLSIELTAGQILQIQTFAKLVF